MKETKASYETTEVKASNESTEEKGSNESTEAKVSKVNKILNNLCHHHTATSLPTKLLIGLKIFYKANEIRLVLQKIVKKHNTKYSH